MPGRRSTSEPAPPNPTTSGMMADMDQDRPGGTIEAAEANAAALDLLRDRLRLQVALDRFVRQLLVLEDPGALAR